MKFIFYFLILSLTASQSFSQKSYIDIYTSHIFLCDSGGTTLEVNFCTSDKLAFADSLLNQLYKNGLRSFDKEISENSIKLKKKQRLKLKSKGDIDDINFYLKQIDQTKRLKQAIINSQRQWIIYKELNSSVDEIYYEEGTGRIAYVNLALLEDTLARIKKLEEWFYDE